MCILRVTVRIFSFKLVFFFPLAIPMWMSVHICHGFYFSLAHFIELRRYKHPDVCPDFLKQPTLYPIILDKDFFFYHFPLLVPWCVMRNKIINGHNSPINVRCQRGIKNNLMKIKMTMHGYFHMFWLRVINEQR